jgi:hypothetical protein
LIFAVPDLLKNVIFTWFPDDKKNTSVKKISGNFDTISWSSNAVIIDKENDLVFIKTFVAGGILFIIDVVTIKNAFFKQIKGNNY